MADRKSARKPEKAVEPPDETIPPVEVEVVSPPRAGETPQPLRSRVNIIERIRGTSIIPRVMS